MWCLVVLLLSLSICSQADDERDVVVLKESNFNDIVNNNDLVLVEFYAPWCGHCQKLVPEYAKAATALKSHDPPITLAKVDATAESSLANKYNVNGYPTLKIFRRGVPSEYGGPRQAQGIIEYMKKQVGPSSTQLDNIGAAEILLISPEEPVIAGFFAEASSSDAMTFQATANSLRDKFKFAHAHNSDVLDHFGYRHAIVMFKPYDDTEVVFSGTVSQPSVTNWIYQNYLPLAGHITQQNMELYQRKGKPVLEVLINVDFKNNKKYMDFYLKRLRKAAKVFPGLSFAVADKTEFQSERDRFGLTGKEEHQMIIDDVTTQEKYKYAGTKFSLDTVKEFAQQFVDKAIKPYIKSEPVPPPSQPGEVAVVVGENFKDIVLDNTKDVLIEFYAPWCGHCKQLEPKYKELAKAFKGVDSVVIAKIDATANDSPHPAYRASGYPTIYFAPANSKDSPIQYNGGREVAEMKKWVMEKASIPITGSKKQKKKKSKQ